MAMSARHFTRYLVVFAAVVILGLGSSMAGKLTGIALEWRKSPSRLYNLQSLPPAVRPFAIDAFILRQIVADRRPLILALGDSQTYGYGLAPQETFVEHLRQRYPDYGIYNLGIINGRVSDFTQIAEMLAARGVSAEMVICNLNLTHVPHSPGVVKPASVWEGLKGLNQLRLMPLLFPASVPAVLHGGDVIDSTHRSLRGLQWEGPGNDELVEFLEAAKKISRKQFIYTSPYPVQSLAASGNDVSLLAASSRRLMDTCWQSVGEDSCDALYLVLEDQAFFDVSHLNANGMIRLAELLGERLFASGNVELKRMHKQ